MKVSLGALLVVAACGGGKNYQLASPEPARSTSAIAGGSYSGGGSYGGGSYEPAPPAHATMQSTPDRVAEPEPDRPGLGTTFGESVYAPISYAPFERSSPSPWAEVLLHYNDEQGVAAHAEYLNARPAPLEVYAGDGSLSVALVDDAGRTLPGLSAGGRTLIVGADGERYRILVRNATTARFEVVASVDGLDVIDGNPADPNRRGYIVDPHDSLVIDGFRTSDANVAAFRFGRVADSYAAQTSGDRNVGVVGLAIFSERGAVWTRAELGRRDSADPFPARGYAVPPH
ncbi:MAG: hypothetical protein JO257_17930 [Deltaproteobacteria bacterium]|nr:hypothetical protein [Deltaproteobacteria bacterium]